MTNPSSANPLFYSRNQTAELLNLSVRTVDRLLDSGRLQSTYVGRRRLVSREQLLNIAGQDVRTKLGA